MNKVLTASCSCGCGMEMDLEKDLPYVVENNLKILCATQECAELVRATIFKGGFPEDICVRAAGEPTVKRGKVKSRNGQVIIPANMILRMRDGSKVPLFPRKPFKRRELN